MAIPVDQAKSKICVALDVATEDEALKLVELLKPYVGVFKVGKQLFTQVGPSIVKRIQDAGCDVFLDLKFHDIPNTVKGASHACAQMGVSLFNVHASGGLKMLKGALEGLESVPGTPSRVLGVTVLTSLSESELKNEIGVARSLSDQVVSLAKLCQRAGLHGVVASPQEIQLIREACGPNFIILTPGIRPTWAEKGDQTRVMTPKDALDAGANYIVIGRPITQAKDPVEAAKKTLEEIF